MSKAKLVASGQTLTETAILLPLFLGLLFSIIQACHLGIAVALVNYGASAYATEAVKQGDSGAAARSRFDKFMIAGLKNYNAPFTDIDKETVTPNISVTACAELPAYPFVGDFLNKAIRPTAADSCGGKPILGPISLKGPPYRFIIRGDAKARMNYGIR